jgi:hypothetical protein
LFAIEFARIIPFFSGFTRSTSERIAASNSKIIKATTAFTIACPVIS